MAHLAADPDVIFSSMPGEHRLVAALIRNAIDDLNHHDPDVRNDALAFLENRDGSLQWWLDAAGLELDAADLRRRLKKS